MHIWRGAAGGRRVVPEVVDETDVRDRGQDDDDEVT
jgi:hypothetical protein